MEIQKVRIDEAVRGATELFNRTTGERHYRNEVAFSFHNHRELIEAFESGRAVDLADVPKQKRKSVIIIGSGPTLDAALPLMKDWEGDIICSTSHAPTLIAWGREPEHIVALDPNCCPDEFDADTWEGRKSILHLHPGVMPDLVRWWKGPMALFRKLQPQTPFYAHEQAMGYSPLGELDGAYYKGNEAPFYITAQVPMLACAIAAQICIAKHLGYAQQILVGCDFSYPGDVERFTRRSWKDGKWIDHKPLPLDRYDTQPGASQDPVIETEFDGLKSSGMQIFYSHQTVIAWRIIEKDVINSSHKGLLRMFPYVPLEEIIRRGNKGVKGFTLPQRRIASEEYLARQNIYFIYIGKGMMPHVFKDPLHEIPTVLPQLKEQLKGSGRADDLDVDANMRRIKRLFRKVMEG